VHGESGYIANSVDEMALYATQLGKDYELRKRIGEKGREQYIAMRKENNGESRFHEVYEKASFSNKSFTVPLSYRLKYYFYCYKDYLRNLFDYY
jgi:glycosyltransferase involved in cell wall biosynthesis